MSWSKCHVLLELGAWSETQILVNKKTRRAGHVEVGLRKEENNRGRRRFSPRERRGKACKGSHGLAAGKLLFLRHPAKR
jgi:hypothetical protein